MEIVNNAPSNKVLFRNLKNGDVFKSNNYYYIKSLNHLDQLRATNLQSGMIISIDNAEQVLPIKGKFHIESED
jgi:hypothetical protein